MQRPKKPTHAAVTRFIASILPTKDNDVPRLYHVPRNPRYDPETAVIEQVVLSVTPTPGVYALIGYLHDDPNAQQLKAPPSPPHAAPIPHSLRPPRTLCFLHRPFTLDRHNVRKDTLVLSSHTAFDEVLTVGWNTALASRLGLAVDESFCVQGYKGDSERRIGIVGKLSQQQQQREVLVRRIQQEFGATELVHEGPSDEIRVVAVMNAFHEDEVRRVVEMARQRGWCAGVDEDAPGKHMLYLTGQPRVGGMQAAMALGMTIACVGHRQAEDWGIRYLAASLREAFPGVHVEEVYEEEMPVVRERKVTERIYE
ncbi:Nn.00g036020.m01.CDS01 [Neocucurbitaria sp. VM-36]